MKNIIKYVKDNRLYLAILVAGLVLLFVQLNQVIMYADDYTLGIHSNAGGFQSAWNYFIYNYLHWGGGWTGLIVISILTIGFKLWLFVELFLMFAIILITVKFIHLKDGKYKELTALLVWLLYFIINIYTSRETIYWLDGSIAYVFTTLQVLFYTYLIYTRTYYPKMRKKYDYVIFPLAAFFGGWSSAQSGAVVVLISIIVWLFAKYVNKIKIPKFYLVSSVLTLIGYLIFFFAPGNSARMSAQGMFTELGLFSKVLYKADCLYGVFFGFRMYPYFGLVFFTFLLITLLILVTHHILKKEKNEKLKFIMSLTCIYNCLYIALAVLSTNSEFLSKFFLFNNIYMTSITKVFTIKSLVPYGVATITVICMIMQTIYISIKNKDSLLTLLVSCGIFSQLVMLMAPTHPLRTTLISIVVFIAAILYLFKYVLEKDIRWEYLVATVFLFKTSALGLMLIATYFAVNYFLKDNKIISTKKLNLTIFVSLLAAISIYNWIIITGNYKINKLIDAENMIRIEQYKENANEEKILVLVAPKDEAYGFTPLAGSDWIEEDVVKYFKLEKGTDIMFEEEYEEYINSKSDE